METSKGPGTWMFGVAIAVVAAIAVGAYLWMHRAPPPAPPPVAQQAPPPPADAPLPPAEQSDASLRGKGIALSPRPELSKWLEQPGILERWAVVTDNLAEDVSPRKQLGFLAPAGQFKVEQMSGRSFIDPRSYARYDTFADVVASVDAKAFATLVRDLHGIIEAAYHALGYPGRKLDVTAAQALQRLMSAPVLAGPVEVKPGRGALYAYADPKLEHAGEVEKHLLRMGPRNTHLIQAKAREIAQALDLPMSAARTP